MQVGTIAGQRAAEAEDLQIAIERGALLPAGQPQLSHRQAADTADHATSLLPLLSHPGFKVQEEIVAGLQPQWRHLHGHAPSSKLCTITRAST